MVARHESLLTEVMEAFRALLFPFKWESCYVSVVCVLNVYFISIPI